MRNLLGLLVLVGVIASTGCATLSDDQNSDWVESCVEKRKLASGFPVSDETLENECRTIEKDKWRAHQKKRQERAIFGAG